MSRASCLQGAHGDFVDQSGRVNPKRRRQRGFEIIILRNDNDGICGRRRTIFRCNICGICGKPCPGAGAPPDDPQRLATLLSFARDGTSPTLAAVGRGAARFLPGRGGCRRVRRRAGDGAMIVRDTGGSPPDRRSCQTAAIAAHGRDVRTAAAGSRGTPRTASPLRSRRVATAGAQAGRCITPPNGTAT
jgi:hypothetical protein